MSIRAGRIEFYVGARRLRNAEHAMDELTAQTRTIQKKVGDLTRPFDKISSKLLRSIKQRFDSGAFDKKEFTGGEKITKSRWTRAVRKARGANPVNPALKQTGALKNSIQRMPSPTKTKGGRRREVAVLRLGSQGVPYAQIHLTGGEWRVPVRAVDDDSFPYLDYDELDDVPSNRQMYGNQWTKISTLPKRFKTVEIPVRNYFALSNNDEAMIEREINKALQNTIKGEVS